MILGQPRRPVVDINAAVRIGCTTGTCQVDVIVRVQADTQVEFHATLWNPTCFNQRVFCGSGCKLWQKCDIKDLLICSNPLGAYHEI